MESDESVVDRIRAGDFTKRQEEKIGNGIPSTTSGFFSNMAVAVCSHEESQPKLVDYDVRVTLLERVVILKRGSKRISPKSCHLF